MSNKPMTPEQQLSYYMEDIQSNAQNLNDAVQAILAENQEAHQMLDCANVPRTFSNGETLSLNNRIELLVLRKG